MAELTGAAGLPCAIFRGYQGSDLVGVNAHIKFITCPFTNEQLAAVPAIRPEVTIIHAQRADRAGNVLIEGIIGVQKEAALAATNVIVTVEELVDDLLASSPNSTMLPYWTIDAIVEAQGGALPSYTHGYYRLDNAFYSEWDAKEIEQNTGWPIRFASSLEETAPPNEIELAVLRDLHARTELAHTGKATPHA